MPAPVRMIPTRSPSSICSSTNFFRARRVYAALSNESVRSSTTRATVRFTWSGLSTSGGSGIAGFDLSIFDSYVKISRLLGKNKEFIDREVPHLDRLLAPTAEAALDGAQVIVVGHADAVTRQAIIAQSGGRRIVDLSGYADLRAIAGVEYEGICW